MISQIPKKIGLHKFSIFRGNNYLGKEFSNENKTILPDHRPLPADVPQRFCAELSAILQQ
jgi:hypothetical protein